MLAALAPFAIVAMASTPAILSGGGGLDISIGPIAVLANVVLIEWLLGHGGIGSAWLAIPIVVLLGAAIGALNGVLVAVFRYQSVIATLCTFFVLAGVIAKIAPAPKTAPAGTWLTGLGDKVGPVPGGLLLDRRSAGRLVAAVADGVSPQPLRRRRQRRDGLQRRHRRHHRARARLQPRRGLRRRRRRRAHGARAARRRRPGFAQYTLIALAAVALGGTQLGGGRGGLVASLLGACCIYFMQTLLGALEVSSAWLNFVYGCLLVAGVVVGAKLLTLRPREATA